MVAGGRDRRRLPPRAAAAAVGRDRHRPKTAIDGGRRPRSTAAEGRDRCGRRPLSMAAEGRDGDRWSRSAAAATASGGGGRRPRSMVAEGRDRPRPEAVGQRWRRPKTAIDGDRRSSADAKWPRSGRDEGRRRAASSVLFSTAYLREAAGVRRAQTPQAAAEVGCGGRRPKAAVDCGRRPERPRSGRREEM